MEHGGIVVDDLAAATECFVELGLELTTFHAPTSSATTVERASPMGCRADQEHREREA
jgi:hypothetical protein